MTSNRAGKSSSSLVRLTSNNLLLWVSDINQIVEPPPFKLYDGRLKLTHCLHASCILFIYYLLYFIYYIHTYLKFGAHATHGVGVKFFKWEEFFPYLTRKEPLWNLVECVLFHTQCVILHTMSIFSPSVWFYTQCVILHTVCNLHSV